MPAFPVVATVTNLNAMSMWKAGRIAAANVDWLVDLTAAPAPAGQKQILATLAIAKGYNAVRLQFNRKTEIDYISRVGWDCETPDADTHATLAPTFYAARIQAALDACKDLGMGVILDLAHDFYQGGSAGELWTSAARRQALVNFWSKTAAKWNASTSPALIGFELLNEPFPDHSLTFANMLRTADNNWYQLATDCRNAIRVSDTQTPIVVDSIYYADALGLKFFDTSGLLDDPNVVYSFHMYAPMEFTHQGVFDDLYESIGTPYPCGYWNGWQDTGIANPDNGGQTGWDISQTFNSAADIEKRCKAAIDFKTAHPGVPLFLGEFSAVDASLIPPTQVPASSARRTITSITVGPGSGGLNLAKATLGNLSGFNINISPSGSASGPFVNNNALASVESSNPALNVNKVAVQLERGKNFFTYPTAAAQGSTGTGTLKLTPGGTPDASRVTYTKHVLAMCLKYGFSWAWHFEDTDLNNTAFTTINSFVGWRPSTSISAVLTSAATRRITG